MIQELHCFIKGKKVRTKELGAYNLELVNNFCNGKKKCVLRGKRFSLPSIGFPCPSRAQWKVHHQEQSLELMDERPQVSSDYSGRAPFLPFPISITSLGLTYPTSTHGFHSNSWSPAQPQTLKAILIDLLWTKLIKLPSNWPSYFGGRWGSREPL